MLSSIPSRCSGVPQSVCLPVPYTGSCFQVWFQHFWGPSYGFVEADHNQWLFLVPLKGGRWHIIPQKAIYKWYLSGIYCQLGDYMPTRNNRTLMQTVINCWPGQAVVSFPHFFVWNLWQQFKSYGLDPAPPTNSRKMGLQLLSGHC